MLLRWIVVITSIQLSGANEKEALISGVHQSAGITVDLAREIGQKISNGAYSITTLLKKSPSNNGSRFVPVLPKELPVIASESSSIDARELNETSLASFSKTTVSTPTITTSAPKQNRSIILSNQNQEQPHEHKHRIQSVLRNVMHNSMDEMVQKLADAIQAFLGAGGTDSLNRSTEVAVAVLQQKAKVNIVLQQLLSNDSATVQEISELLEQQFRNSSSFDQPLINTSESVDRNNTNSSATDLQLLTMMSDDATNNQSALSDYKTVVEHRPISTDYDWDSIQWNVTETAFNGVAAERYIHRSPDNNGDNSQNPVNRSSAAIPVVGQSVTNIRGFLKPGIVNSEVFKLLADAGVDRPSLTRFPMVSSRASAGQRPDHRGWSNQQPYTPQQWPSPMQGSYGQQATANFQQPISMFHPNPRDQQSSRSGPQMQIPPQQYANQQFGGPPFSRNDLSRVKPPQWHNAYPQQPMQQPHPFNYNQPWGGGQQNYVDNHSPQQVAPIYSIPSPPIYPHQQLMQQHYPLPSGNPQHSLPEGLPSPYINHPSWPNNGQTNSNNNNMELFAKRPQSTYSQTSSELWSNPLPVYAAFPHGNPMWPMTSVGTSLPQPVDPSPPDFTKPEVNAMLANLLSSTQPGHGPVSPAVDNRPDSTPSNGKNRPVPKPTTTKTPVIEDNLSANVTDENATTISTAVDSSSEVLPTESIDVEYASLEDNTTVASSSEVESSTNTTDEQLWTTVTTVETDSAAASSEEPDAMDPMLHRLTMHHHTSTAQRQLSTAGVKATAPTPLQSNSGPSSETIATTDTALELTSVELTTESLPTTTTARMKVTRRRRTTTAKPLQTTTNELEISTDFSIDTIPNHHAKVLFHLDAPILPEFASGKRSGDGIDNKISSNQLMISEVEAITEPVTTYPPLIIFTDKSTTKKTRPSATKPYSKHHHLITGSPTSGISQSQRAIVASNNTLIARPISSSNEHRGSLLAQTILIGCATAVSLVSLICFALLMIFYRRHKLKPCFYNQNGVGGGSVISPASPFSRLSPPNSFDCRSNVSCAGYSMCNDRLLESYFAAGEMTVVSKESAYTDSPSGSSADLLRQSSTPNPQQLPTFSNTGFSAPLPPPPPSIQSQSGIYLGAGSTNEQSGLSMMY